MPEGGKVVPQNQTLESSAALSWVGSICSVLGLVGVLVLQRFDLNNYTLLFWWVITAVIAVAALGVCFNPPSFGLRVVFAIVFVTQMPAFNEAWSKRYERDTVMRVGLGKTTQQEQRIQTLEQENEHLKWTWRDTLFFWEGIAHLTGMGFALLACTAAGQRRIRIMYEVT